MRTGTSDVANQTHLRQDMTGRRYQLFLRYAILRKSIMNLVCKIIPRVTASVGREEIRE